MQIYYHGVTQRVYVGQVSSAEIDMVLRNIDYNTFR